MSNRDILMSAAGTSSITKTPVYFAATSGKVLYYSTDGVTWISRGTISGFTSSIYQIVYANGILVIFDQTLTYRQSTDDGLTFTAPIKLTTVGPGAVYTYEAAIDPTGQYVVVGSDAGRIFYSSNYGVTFSVAYPGSANIYAVQYANEYFLYGQYNTGQFYRAPYNNPSAYSTVGSTGVGTYVGSTWDESTNTVYTTPLNTTTGKKSTNLGTSWSTVTFPVSGYYYGIESYNGLLISFRNTTTVYRSTNGGSSWSTATVTGNALWVAQANGLFVLVTASSLYTSTDGATWTSRLTAIMTACGAGLK